MIGWAVRHRVSTLVGATTLVALGLFSALHLPVALLPTLERPRLEMLVAAPGHSREELTRGLTEPWERRLAALAELTSLRSETEDGLVRFFLEADWGADADRLRLEALRLVEGSGSVDHEPVDTSLVAGDASPVLELAVIGGTSATERGRFAAEIVRPELARVRGAGRLDVVGAVDTRVLVKPRAADLAARGLNASVLENRLTAIGRPLSAGVVRDGSDDRSLVARDVVTSLEGLARVALSAATGSAALGDVAEISLGEVRDSGRCLVDGESAVLLRAWRAPSANAVVLARESRRVIERLRRAAPPGLKLEVVADRSLEVTSALSSLGLAALSGILLGTLVLRLFLGRWSATLALALVIPASVLASFCAFYGFGVALDVVSLAGLTLAAGLLVDNSIVVLEAIEVARQEGADEPEVAGTRQVGGAVAAASATTLVVFLPLLYLEGLVRAFFGEQAFAIVASLTASLLFALTLTPVLARFARGGAGGRQTGRGLYLAVLDWVLARPVLAAIVGTLLVSGALGLGLALPRELLPASDARDLRIDYELPPQLAQSEADARENELLRVLRMAVPDASVVLARGLPELDAVSLATGAEPRNGRIMLRFEDPERAHEALAHVREELAEVTFVRARVRPRPSSFVEAVTWAGEGFEVIATASTDRRASALAGRAAGWLRDTTRATPRFADPSTAPRALFLDWDESRLLSLGLETSQLESVVRTSLGSRDLGRVDFADEALTIRLEPTLVPNLSLLPLGRPPEAIAAQARLAPPSLFLGALARLEPGQRTGQLVREDGRPARRVVLLETGALDPEQLESGLQSMRESHDEQLRLAGEALEFSRAFDGLRLALALALVLAFVTLAGLSESLRLPLIVMSTIPVGVAGGLGALALVGQSLNLMSFLGLILLAGLVVNSAIVLLHRVEQRLREGRGHREALRAAAAERYRPILMTTATTVFGMLPLALLGGDGEELRRSLAVAVLGGLITSTPAALLLVPVLHLLSFRGRRG